MPKQPPTSAQTVQVPKRLGFWPSLVLWLARGFGLGLLPGAPGTWGALLGLALSVAWSGSSWWIQALGTLGLVVLGVPVCSLAQRHLKKADPAEVVWDELATVPLVFVLCPVPESFSWAKAAMFWAAGFGLHRLLDIAKPRPVKIAERLGTGWGIMADDVVAAVGAALGLWGLRATASLLH